jgi:hypothetical protein
VEQEVEPTKRFARSIEHAFQGPVGLDIEWQQKAWFNRPCNGCDEWLCLLVQIGKYEFGSCRVEGLRATRRDRLVIGDADDKSDFSRQ